MNLPLARPVVWWARTDALDACEPGLIARFSLSAKDKARHCRLVRTTQQQSFFLSRLLLAMLVRDQLRAGIEIVHTVNSAPRLLARKPVAEPRKLTASLSHCDTLVAVALAANGCGVDVENVRKLRDLDVLCERVFDENSHRASAELGPGEQRTFFFKIWTAKESYLKARGLGLSVDPVEVLMQRQGHNLWLPRMADDRTNGGTRDAWRTWALDLPPGHVGALTIERGSDASPPFDSREVVVDAIQSFLTLL